MQVNADPELQAKAIEALRVEYNMGKPREGLHQSQLSHCLTRSYFDLTDPEPISDKQALYFGIGFAMERVIFDRGHEQTLVVDGITLSLDDITKFGGGVDLKTTRKAAKGRKDEDGFQFPETWPKQFAAYVYGLNRIAAETCSFCGLSKLWHEHHDKPCANFRPSPESFSFGAIVVHLVTADITAWRVTYERWELEENWSWLLTRRDQLDSMLAGQNPMPFEFNEPYECPGCPYLMRCQLTKSIEELTNG